MERSRNLILVSCIILLFACAKTQVRIYPEKPSQAEPLTEASPTPTPKPSPEEPSPGRIPPAGAYDETVSKWKSYQDLVRWMEKDFSLDAGRFEKSAGRLPPPQTAEETFNLRSGIHIDAAFFIEGTLNRINPSYEAKIVVILIRPYGNNHYACSFKLDGKLYIMDYGTPYKTVTGLHGPYDSLEEYKQFYEKNLPTKPRIEAITYLP
jgi:hypothetical protein